MGRLADIIEAIRQTYEVDHSTYYAVSLGLDALEQEHLLVEESTNRNGILVQSGRRVAAVSYPTEWMHWYIEQNYYEFDPVHIGAMGSFDPVDWADLDWSGPTLRSFRAEAEAIGVGNQGYTIPVRGPGGQFAMFSVNRQCSDRDWQLFLAECRTDLLLLAHYLHQRVLALSGLGQSKPSRSLSTREKDAIRLIAKGLSRGRASEALGISENTFRVYIDSARHKLGALNIPNAIALAVHRGIIPPS
ncbi:MAG: LuxR family transcriptional regulator [Pseudomonadota bacterium]